ncbi:aquaporin AQPcic-like isoform X2 [Neodiprion fabricii]|uniref:aquaporin AQPcic-like isoform X2 n=1 Tax=Neodiprion fabricii TaxID=2872261 RepID=UPI001ED94D28|nr:aquaporin AQPcic-like isoform X2 [Neodiprion fabricii]
MNFSTSLYLNLNGFEKTICAMRTTDNESTLRFTWKRNFGIKQLLKDEASWSQTLVAGLAEFLGTAILIFVGCMGCVGSLTDIPNALQTALTFGFAVTCVIQIIGHISVAHINPAVTVSAVILGHKSLPAAAVYILAQLSGAVVGYGMLKAITPTELLHNGDDTSASSFCVTLIHSKISVIQGLIVETVTTGVLILLCCASWDPRNARNSDSTPIKFGLTVTTLSLSGGPYTGCSMNPARTFGPALWNNAWSSHWVYWLGPMAGSILATLAYKTLFWPRKPADKDIPEAAALNSVATEKQEVN